MMLRQIHARGMPKIQNNLEKLTRTLTLLSKGSSWHGLAKQNDVSTSSATSEDPFAYTSGHWLHRDKVQREARSLHFNFPLLWRKAVDVCPGASKVLRYEKKEGGFNRVFVLYMDNGVRLVARVPFGIAGPRHLTTDSEVATMKYLQAETNIPIPELLDWNSDPTSPVGTEYIIMEHAPGIQMQTIWPKMNTIQRMLATQNIALEVVSPTANLKFERYGSLYFDYAHLKWSDTTISPSVPRDSFTHGEGFVVGPHCGHDYWDTSVTDKNLTSQDLASRGPWLLLEDFTAALVNAGHRRLQRLRADSWPETFNLGSIEEHARLLIHSSNVLAQLVDDSSIQKISRLTLMHPDLNKRNIFVDPEDPTRITAVIDWQSTSIEPAFMYANNTPDLIDYSHQSLSIDAVKEGEFEHNTPTHEQKRLQREFQICHDTFEVVLQASSECLASARRTDDTLLQLFHTCHSSSKLGAVVLRQVLFKLSARWSELGLSGLCPYQPSTHELVEHARQWDDFETTQTLKNSLMQLLNTTSEGWVSTERWNSVRKMHQELYSQRMETVMESDDPEMTEARGQSIWPWDGH